MHVWSSIRGRRKWISWRIVHSLLTNCSEVFIFGTYWESWYSMVSEQTCTINHKMDQSMWQTPESIDFKNSSHMWTQTLLFCWKHNTTMQIRIVSRSWFCRRPWRLKVNIEEFCVFSEVTRSYQEVGCARNRLLFHIVHKSWGRFSRCRFTHGWDSRYQSLGFSAWSISFFTEPNQ